MLFLVLGLLMLLSITACAAAADSGFRDVAADVWYSDSVAYVKDNGFVHGSPDPLHQTSYCHNRKSSYFLLPTTQRLHNRHQGNATRAEVAVILRNYMLRDSSEPVAVPDTPSGESKTLVVYFSMPETTTADNMTVS